MSTSMSLFGWLNYMPCAAFNSMAILYEHMWGDLNYNLEYKTFSSFFVWFSISRSMITLYYIKTHSNCRLNAIASMISVEYRMSRPVVGFMNHITVFMSFIGSVWKGFMAIVAPILWYVYFLTPIVIGLANEFSITITKGNYRNDGLEHSTNIVLSSRDPPLHNYRLSSYWDFHFKYNMVDVPSHLYRWNLYSC